ncbi:hypothetical protein BC826DRAFT_973927 [Russula brevipes]|nr:hypothetical protein BC826DRAFT_973927 [Russula brevipes]
MSRVSWLKDFAREGNCVEESRKERSDYYIAYCTFASSPRPPPRRPIQHGRDILLCTKCRSFVAEGLWSRRVSFVEGGWKKVVDLVHGSAGSDARGVLTSRWGTGTRTPRGRKRQKPTEKKKVPRFRTGCLALNGQDASLLPPPRKNIYIRGFDSLNLGVITWPESFLENTTTFKFNTPRTWGHQRSRARARKGIGLTSLTLTSRKNRIYRQDSVREANVGFVAELGIVQPDTDATNTLAFLLGSATTLGASSFHRRIFKRIKNSERKDQMIHIRMAGMDAPAYQVPHLGSPIRRPQPDISLITTVRLRDRLKEYVEGRRIKCQLLPTPPLGVANMHSPAHNLSLEMTREGGVLCMRGPGRYTVTGARTIAEAEALAARRGMWRDGTAIDSPAEYKSDSGCRRKS